MSEGHAERIQLKRRIENAMFQILTNQIENDATPWRRNGGVAPAVS